MKAFVHKLVLLPFYPYELRRVFVLVFLVLVLGRCLQHINKHTHVQRVPPTPPRLV